MIVSCESGTQLLSNDEQRQLIGAYRLASIFLERISETQSIHQACAFLLELLPVLMDADAVSIELPTWISATPFRSPLTFFSGEFAKVPPNAIEVNTQLQVNGKPCGWCRLYYTHPSAEAGEYGKAVLDFIGVCLTRFLSKALNAASILSALSPAERRVLSLLHLCNDEIQCRLGIGNETLRTHSKRIYKKLEVNSRKEAMAIAMEAGITLEEQP